MASMIGSKDERKEDKKFLTGKGRYTADINLHNQLHAVFIRSPHARAKIKAIDTSKAKKAAEDADTNYHDNAFSTRMPSPAHVHTALFPPVRGEHQQNAGLCHDDALAQRDASMQ